MFLTHGVVCVWSSCQMCVDPPRETGGKSGSDQNGFQVWFRQTSGDSKKECSHKSGLRRGARFRLRRVTAAVTESPQKHYNFKKRDIGDFGSPLGYVSSTSYSSSGGATYHNVVPVASYIPVYAQRTGWMFNARYQRRFVLAISLSVSGTDC